jgi:hypothetical protein
MTKHETKRDVQLVLACVLASTMAATLVTGLAFGSRSAGGTYTLPTGNPVVTGTAISSTVHNATMSDVATELTDSLNRSGKGAMLAALQGYVGAVGSPGYTFAGDTDTGIYWIGANNIGIALAGVKVVDWKATGSSVTSGLTLTNVNANSAGLTSTGTGSGAGITATGGTSGVGGAFTAGGGNTNGVEGTAAGNGAGIYGTGNSTGWGGYFQGTASRSPLHLVPGAQPSTAAEGDIYMNGTDHKVYVYTGGAWVVIGTQV